MRGGNRNTRRMMDKMGVDVSDVHNVIEVRIKTDKKEIIITKPTVSEMKTKGETIFTVAGGSQEEMELEVPIFSDDDIQLICQRTGVDVERANAALKDANGDLTTAIIALKEQT